MRIGKSPAPKGSGFPFAVANAVSTSPPREPSIWRNHKWGSSMTHDKGAAAMHPKVNPENQKMVSVPPTPFPCGIFRQGYGHTLRNQWIEKRVTHETSKDEISFHQSDPEVRRVPQDRRRRVWGQQVVLCPVGSGAGTQTPESQAPCLGMGSAESIPTLVWRPVFHSFRLMTSLAQKRPNPENLAPKLGHFHPNLGAYWNALETNWVTL